MLDSRRHPYFFKVYLPSLSSKRLKIPTAFLKHMNDVTSGTCTLMGPSEKIWNVSLREHADGCFLEEGWPVFVSDHFVETGDFLVFRYGGNLQFTVQIFGPNTFEKESAFHATCNQHRRVELEVPTHQADSVMKEAEKEDCVCVYRTPIRTFQKGSEKHHQRTKRRYLSSEANSGCERKHAHKQGYKSQRRCITEEEKARVIEAANAFKSKNPFAVVVLRPSYVYYGFHLCIPTLFWRSHLSKRNQKMTLWDQSGRAWPVKYVFSNAKAGFSAGWGAFSRHHNLEADDVCIFELIKANETRVHVFRAVP